MQVENIIFAVIGRVGVEEPAGDIDDAAGGIHHAVTGTGRVRPDREGTAGDVHCGTRLSPHAHIVASGSTVDSAAGDGNLGPLSGHIHTYSIRLDHRDILIQDMTCAGCDSHRFICIFIVLIAKAVRFIRSLSSVEFHPQLDKQGIPIAGKLAVPQIILIISSGWLPVQNHSIGIAILLLGKGACFGKPGPKWK